MPCLKPLFMAPSADRRSEVRFSEHHGSPDFSTNPLTIIAEEFSYDNVTSSPSLHLSDMEIGLRGESDPKSPRRYLPAVIPLRTFLHQRDDKDSATESCFSFYSTPASLQSGFRTRSSLDSNESTWLLTDEELDRWAMAIANYAAVQTGVRSKAWPSEPACTPFVRLMTTCELSALSLKLRHSPLFKSLCIADFNSCGHPITYYSSDFNLGPRGLQTAACLHAQANHGGASEDWSLATQTGSDGRPQFIFEWSGALVGGNSKPFLLNQIDVTDSIQEMALYEMNRSSTPFAANPHGDRFSSSAVIGTFLKRAEKWKSAYKYYFILSPTKLRGAALPNPPSPPISNGKATESSPVKDGSKRTTRLPRMSTISMVNSTSTTSNRQSSSAGSLKSPATPTRMSPAKSRLPQSTSPSKSRISSLELPPSLLPGLLDSKKAYTNRIVTNTSQQPSKRSALQTDKPASVTGLRIAGTTLKDGPQSPRGTSFNRVSAALPSSGIPKSLSISIPKPASFVTNIATRSPTKPTASNLQRPKPVPPPRPPRPDESFSATRDRPPTPSPTGLKRRPTPIHIKSHIPRTPRLSTLPPIPSTSEPTRIPSSQVPRTTSTPPPPRRQSRTVNMPPTPSPTPSPERRRQIPLPQPVNQKFFPRPVGADLAINTKSRIRTVRPKSNSSFKNYNPSAVASSFSPSSSSSSSSSIASTTYNFPVTFSHKITNVSPLLHDSEPCFQQKWLQNAPPDFRSALDAKLFHLDSSTPEAQAPSEPFTLEVPAECNWDLDSSSSRNPLGARTKRNGAGAGEGAEAEDDDLYSQEDGRDVLFDTSLYDVGGKRGRDRARRDHERMKMLQQQKQKTQKRYLHCIPLSDGGDAGGKWRRQCWACFIVEGELN